MAAGIMSDNRIGVWLLIALGVFSATLGVTAQAAGNCGRQDIVDRAAQRHASDCHLALGYGPGPGHPLGDAHFAFENGRRVGRQQQQLAERQGVRRAGLRRAQDGGIGGIERAFQVQSYFSGQIR